jgi:hypothetical protein
LLFSVYESIKSYVNELLSEPSFLHAGYDTINKKIFLQC